MVRPKDNARLLVVDDDPLVCRAVKRLMSPLGYTVTSARSAAEAVRRFSEAPWPVVITDFRLPGDDGITLVDDLSDIAPATAFVMVTGSPVVTSAHREGDKSIVSIIAKPWDDNELCAAVQQARDLHDLRVTRDLEATRQTLLLVEDNEGDAALVEALLEGTTYDVHWVTRLRDALVYLRDATPSVVISDLGLPDARGLDCVTQIVRAAPTSALLVLSGAADDPLAAQTFRSGAEDYLIKGQIDAPHLRRAIWFATERKRADRRVAQLAHTDALTGLANRAAFHDRIRRAVAHARRAQHRLWLLYLDLDKFKGINDELGHAAGDVVLQAFADRLVASVRPYDVVGRLGGDEFAILLEDVACENDVESIAQRIIAAMAPPVDIAGAQRALSTSIGIAMYPACGDTPDALVATADAAMYVAKRSGANLYCCSGQTPRAA